MGPEVVQDRRWPQASITQDGVAPQLSLLLRLPPALGNVQRLVVQGEEEAVWSGRIVGDAVDGSNSPLACGSSR